MSIIVVKLKRNVPKHRFIDAILRLQTCALLVELLSHTNPDAAMIHPNIRTALKVNASVLRDTESVQQALK